MPMRESRTSREGLQAIVYKYNVSKGIPAGYLDAALAELRRAHEYRSGLVAIDLARDREMDALWAAHPDVGPLMAELAGEVEIAERLAADARALKARERRSRLDDARAAELTAAWAVVRERRGQVKDAKKAGRALVRDELRAIDDARDEAIRDAYTPAVDGGLYWGTVNDITQRHNVAVKMVIAKRKQGRMARLQEHDWDGTGTLRVQLQRGTFDPPRTAAELAVTDCEGAKLTSAGLLRGTCRGCGKPRALNAAGIVKDHRPARGEPWCTGCAHPPSFVQCPVCEQRTGVSTTGHLGEHWLGGKWRNVAGLIDFRGTEDWEALPAAARKKAAMRLRIGQGDAETVITVPVRYHRPIPDDADISDVRLSRTRVGRTYRTTVAFTCLISRPEPRTEGTLSVAHLGWRVLDDGSLRTAVVAAPGPPPDELTDLGVVRWHARQGAGQPGRGGDWGEVIIPAARRASRDLIANVQGTADTNFRLMRDRLVTWLAGHPETADTLDLGGTLADAQPEDLITLSRALSGANLIPGEPAYDEERNLSGWKLPDSSRLTLAELYDLHPLYGEPLAQLLAWRRQHRHLQQWAAFGRENFISWRRDAYRKVAAWLTGPGVALVVLDNWEIPRRKPGLAEGDTVMAHRSRANAVTASPGELRAAVTIACSRRGVRVAEAINVGYGKHQGCGGELPREARSRNLMVECAGRPDADALTPAHVVDQDVNALRALEAAARRGDLVTPGEAGDARGEA
jgi:hypothetical protein